MLEIIFEFIARIIFSIIAEAMIRPLLEQIFRFFCIPVVDDFFNGLAKILAILLVCLIIWTTFYFINTNIQ